MGNPPQGPVDEVYKNGYGKTSENCFCLLIYVALPAAIMSLSYSPLLAIVARLDGAKVVSVDESAFFLLCKHVS